MRTTLLAGLVVIASVVTGEEPPSTPAPPSPEPAPAADAPIGPLVPVRLPAQSGGDDLFRTVASSPPAAPAKPSPAPTAVATPPGPPPLPFTYLGRMRRSNASIVYLLRNQEMVIATAGETLDSAYRVENITEAAMTLVYLPLGVSQTINLPDER